MSVESTDMLSPRLAPPMLPATSAAPSVLAAAALVALYFVLQLAAGILLGLLAGLGLLGYMLVQGAHRSSMRADVAALLQQPDIKLFTISLALLLAAGATIFFVRKRWAALWPLAQTPGFGMRRPPHAADVVIGLMLGLATPVLGGVLTMLLAQGHAVPQDVKQVMAGTGLAAQILFVVTLVTIGPLVEELLFRGVLLSALLRHMHPIWAILLSAATFALVHLPGLNFLWYALPNLALVGLGAAWLRLRAGSIWPAVLLHGVNNLIAVLGWLAGAHGAG